MRKLGEDPDTGLEVTVRSGRFGSYLQLGEPTKDENGEAVKPKRARSAAVTPFCAARPA